MSEEETPDDWTRAKQLLEKYRELGGEMSNIRLVDTNGEGEVLPQAMVKVLLQAARELELGRIPVVAHGDLLLDLVQAADQSSTRPEVMALAVEGGRFPDIRMADGRQMVPLFAVAELLTAALDDDRLAMVRVLREIENAHGDDDDLHDVPF